MKVLFLDCDGVLNDHRDAEVTGDNTPFFRLNFRKMDRLKKLVEDTGCKIVLSSSWRLFDGGVKILEENGIKIYDVTKHFNSGFRGHEIQDWLDRHTEVTNYAIVDDDGDMMNHQFQHFVQTDPEIGLSDSAAYRITARLEIPKTKSFGEILKDAGLAQDEIEKFGKTLDKYWVKND